MMPDAFMLESPTRAPDPSIVAVLVPGPMASRSADLGDPVQPSLGPSARQGIPCGTVTANRPLARRAAPVTFPQSDI